MSIYQAIRWAYPIFGLRGLAGMAAARFKNGPVEFSARPAGIRNPVRVRARTTDLPVYKEVFIDRDYASELQVDPKVIIDAGANVGYTAIYFANIYPRARIIAIEPETKNFDLLRRNAAPYGNIETLNAAVWASDGFVSLYDPGIGAYGFQVRSRPGSVPAISLATLLRRHNVDRVDLLKIDIEGSEREVFSGSPAWISQVDFLVVEPHDWVKPGCSATVKDALREFQCWGDDHQLRFKRVSPTTAEAREAR